MDFCFVLLAALTSLYAACSSVTVDITTALINSLSSVPYTDPDPVIGSIGFLCWTCAIVLLPVAWFVTAVFFRRRWKLLVVIGGIQVASGLVGAFLHPWLFGGYWTR